jgi:hypothetical protein
VRNAGDKFLSVVPAIEATFTARIPAEPAAVKSHVELRRDGTKALSAALKNMQPDSIAIDYNFRK